MLAPRRIALMTLCSSIALASVGCSTTPPPGKDTPAGAPQGASSSAPTTAGGTAIPLLGGDGWDSPQLAAVGGKALDNSFYSVHVDLSSKDKRVAEFVKAYLDRYKVQADTLGLLAYDSVYLIADAYKRAGKVDKEALRTALASTSGFAGVCGSISMNEDRDPIKQAVVVRMVDGQTRYAATIAPPSTPSKTDEGAKAPQSTAAAPAAPAATSGSGAPSSGDSIKLGCYFSMTGSTATFGASSMNGIRLAVDEINGHGGVLGKKLEIVLEDDESAIDKAALAVKKLINEKQVDCVIGDVGSSNSIAGGTVAQEAHVPLLTPSSTNPKVTKVGPYVFRACFTDRFQGYAMARYALDNLHAHTAAIVTDKSSDYSLGLTTYFKEVFEKGGGKIVDEESYNANETDFKGQLTRIKGLKPDVIYVPGYYGDVALMARQVREMQITTPLTLPSVTQSATPAKP